MIGTIDGVWPVMAAGIPSEFCLVATIKVCAQRSMTIVERRFMSRPWIWLVLVSFRGSR
ncbi:hypothetical protein N9C84_00430 [Desulfobacterales bacterium]|nr:hypothetical protein [Desulfobacterales bacterium]